MFNKNQTNVSGNFFGPQIPATTNSSHMTISTGFFCTLQLEKYFNIMAVHDFLMPLLTYKPSRTFPNQF